MKHIIKLKITNHLNKYKRYEKTKKNDRGVLCNNHKINKYKVKKRVIIRKKPMSRTLEQFLVKHKEQNCKESTPLHLVSLSYVGICCKFRNIREERDTREP